MSDTEKPRFESHIKKHLVRVDQNLYINPSDPSYYHKVLQYINPECPESHYQLGQQCEQGGRISKAVYHYTQAAKGSSPYWFKAKEALKRLTQHSDVRRIEQKSHPHFDRPTLTKSLMIALLLVNMILLFMILKLVLSSEVNSQVRMVPFDLPPNVRQQDPGKQNLKFNLHYQGSSNSNLSALDPKDEHPLTFVGTNLVRTALQTYWIENGVLPSNLDLLVMDYPENYLEFIPIEPLSGSNQVVDFFDGGGGWVYNRFAHEITESFFPNVPEFRTSIPFQPVEIMVSKADYSLYLSSGDYLIFRKEIGLGMNNGTPVGTFTVLDRVRNPRGLSDGIYGLAGLGMGNVAIHGTFDEDSIRSNLSLGCIRLTNEDVMAIFPFVPKGTEVKILPNFTVQWKDDKVSPSSLIPSVMPNTDQTPDMVFYWLG